jgi:hypothetical protein
MFSVPFLFYLFTMVQGINIKFFYAHSYKAGYHKFDNSWLSLAGSYKLVMTFGFGQNIKISI